jgi:hypothetical protein
LLLLGSLLVGGPMLLGHVGIALIERHPSLLILFFFLSIFWYNYSDKSCHSMLVTYTTFIVLFTGSVVVTTNTNHAGYDQRRIPTIHQPNPNARTMPAAQQTNPNHYGYDQQQVQFPPMPPPSYENVIKETPK